MISVVALWCAVAIAAGLLALNRYDGAVAGGPGVDIRFFAEAARAVARGDSPYSVDGYVYPPLLAVALAPLADWQDLFRFWAALSLAAAVLTCCLVVHGEGVRGWKGAVATGVALVSVLSFWPTTMILFLGQVDLLLLLIASLLVGTAASRPVASGGLAGALGALKSWPGSLLIALLFDRRMPWQRTLLAAGLVLATVPLTLLAVGGPTTAETFVRRTVEASDQNLVSYSV